MPIRDQAIKSLGEVEKNVQNLSDLGCLPIKGQVIIKL